jgi:Pyruvate/2-oxoacid:ferredoxin oxidoreductase delta subunit
MSEKDLEIFAQVADMIVETDPVGGPKTPAFVRLLSLQLTEAEARLALKIRTTGGTLDELVERTGVKKDKLQKMLLRMADKGSVFYEPGDDPVYRVIGMAAPGWIETGLWGGIKFPFSVELAKAINEVLKEWSDEKLSKLGFPFAPVWAAVDALPKDADKSLSLAEAVKNEGHWSVSPCPCRLSQWITDPGNHCEHMLETCIHTGGQSRWVVKHGMGRELTYEELVDLLKKCSEDGLVHTLNIQNCICNCCSDCCAIFYGQNKGHKVFVPSPFVPEVAEESCNNCNQCVERCPVHAIKEANADEMEEAVSIDHETCIGCGVCVITCKPDALRLVQRAAAA